MLISRNLAVCMYNADYSGITKEEKELIVNFPMFHVIDWKEESSDINGRCSITGLWDHCVEIEILDKEAV